MIESNPRPINNPELAQIMAYAEAPYRDLAVEESKSPHEVETLLGLANYAGMFAARKYIDDLQEQIRNHDTNSNADILKQLDIAFEEQLTTPLNALSIDSEDSRLASRVSYVLARNGVKDLRDILVYGQNKISGMPGIGRASHDYIKKIIISEFGDISIWEYEPNAQDIAQWCENLNQVSARVLPAQSIRDYGYRVRDLSIQTVLDMSEEDIAAELGDMRLGKTEHEYLSEPNLEIAAQLKEEAKRFATAFNASRTQE
jgi:hypothetical protein